MRALTLPTAAALTLGAFATWPSHAAVLLSENFDELTPQLGATAVGALHTIDGTNVDIVGGALFGSLWRRPSREIALIWMEQAAILLASFNRIARLPSIPAPPIY